MHSDQGVAPLVLLLLVGTCVVSCTGKFCCHLQSHLCLFWLLKQRRVNIRSFCFLNISQIEKKKINILPELFRGLVVCSSHWFHFTPKARALFRLGAEKSNSPDAKGIIKVLLRAFLASSKTVKIHVKSKAKESEEL